MTVWLYRLFTLAIPVFTMKPDEGRNAHNNLLGIWIKRDLPHRAAVLFQEQIEAAFRRTTVLAVLAPAATLAWLLSDSVYVAAFAGLLSTFVLRLPVILRGLEYRGQSVESYLKSLDPAFIATTPIDITPLDWADLQNAAQLKHGYDQFADVAQADIAAGLRARRRWAARLAEALRDKWA